MAVRYHHTQPGILMLIVFCISAVVCASVATSQPGPGGGVGWIVAIALAVLGWLFSSLTVDVTEDEVRWHFGPGFWRYRIARSEIHEVQIVRNSWLSGFGIRTRPGWRLYNVSGLDAVELRLRNGAIRRLGTDDAHALAAALKS